jgi:hypothetical protein
LLNAGKTSSLGPLHVIFIPLSSTKLYKQKGVSVLNAFATPFFEEMD